MIENGNIHPDPNVRNLSDEELINYMDCSNPDIKLLVTKLREYMGYKEENEQLEERVLELLGEIEELKEENEELVKSSTLD